MHAIGLGALRIFGALVGMQILLFRAGVVFVRPHEAAKISNSNLIPPGCLSRMLILDLRPI